MRAAIAILFFALCATVRAQELDIFDPTDYIDPRERGGVFREGKIGLSDPGPPFAVIRAYAGRVNDYQWHDTVTDADLWFAHVASSFYRGDKQLTVKFTAFHADQDANVPAYRGTVQLGQYFLTRRLPIDDAPGDPRISGRVLVTWSAEENPFRDERSRGRLNHDFGAQADLRLPLPIRIGTADHIDGSIVWMRRRLGDGDYVDRISYLYRFRQRLRSNGRLHLNAHLGLGTQRDETWRCCLARAVFTATFVIPRLDTGINVAFAPTWSRGIADRDVHKGMHNELAIYLDRTVLARLGDIVMR
jgi:hypothetical protein